MCTKINLMSKYMYKKKEPPAHVMVTPTLSMKTGMLED